MPITVQTSSGRTMSVDSDSVLIGRDPNCDIALPEERDIHPQHARIKKVANRWMIESEGDWPIQVGNGVPGRKLWLSSGDAIRLTESGPEIVFIDGSVSTVSHELSPISIELSPVPSSIPPLNAGRPTAPPFRSTEHRHISQWYYIKGGQQHGPVTAENLKDLAASGQILPTDLVWKEGMPQWVQVQTVTELFPERTPPQSSVPTIPRTSPELLPSGNTARPMTKPTSAGSRWAWLTDKNHPVSKIAGGLLSLLVLLGLCARWYVRSVGLPTHGLGRCLTFNRGQLFYKAPVTEAKARQLGQYLVQNDFFNGEPKSTQITKSEDRYVFRMVLKKGFEPGVFWIEMMRTCGRQLSHSVFNGVPVEMHLCDDKFNTQRVLPPASGMESPEEAMQAAIYQRVMSIVAACQTAENIITNEHASPVERSQAIDSLLEGVRGMRNEINSMIVVLEQIKASDLAPDEQAELSADLSSMREVQASLPVACEALERMKAAGSKVVFEENWNTFQRIMDEICPPDSVSSDTSASTEPPAP